MKKSLGLLGLCALCLVSPRALAGPTEDLWAACKKGNLEGATKALDAGAKINAQDPDGGTAIAAAYLWPEITKLLLARKANPNPGAGAPVVRAASYYSIETLKLLGAPRGLRRLGAPEPDLSPDVRHRRRVAPPGGVDPGPVQEKRCGSGVRARLPKGAPRSRRVARPSPCGTSSRATCGSRRAP